MNKPTMPLALPELEPGFSLVIPTYDRATLVVETVKSALAQTRPFRRIVVVDDGSTDDTAEHLKPFGHCIHYVRTANQGVQTARNVGVRATSTQWVSFCDSDDLLLPTYVEEVERLVYELSQSGAEPWPDALYCNFELFNPSGPLGDKLARAPHNFFQGSRRLGHWQLDMPNLYERLLQFQPMFPTGLALQRSFFEQLGGFNPDMRGIAGEDFEFTLRAAARGRIAYATQPLAQVRKHGGNETADSPRMHFGDARVLQHALLHHQPPAGTCALIERSMQRRLMLAYDGYFAVGNFKAAAEVDAWLPAQATTPKRSLKRWIMRLPPPWRHWFWRVTQQLHADHQTPITEPRCIAVLEPAWDGKVHLPSNLGLLRIVHAAYPNAQLHYVGGKEQLALVRAQCPAEVLACTTLHPWQVAHDRDAGPWVARQAQQRLASLPGQLAHKADLLVFASCTATSLNAVTQLGLAGKCLSMLHGNAGELRGWRSRNPVLRWFDLTGALGRYAAAGGRTLVLEARIRDQLSSDFPWLEPSLGCIPHPLLPEEAQPPRAHMGRPIRVGFLGGATLAKGFPEFVELARLVTASRPGVFEFRAIGGCTKECADLDQSCLARPAADPLPRDEFLQEVTALDFLFTWQKDDYYGDAASGVVYDAVNRCMPMLGRHRAQLAVWKGEGRDVGHTFEDLESLKSWMTKIEEQHLAARYVGQCESMQQIQEALSLQKLAKRLRGIVRPAGH